MTMANIVNQSSKAQPPLGPRNATTTTGRIFASDSAKVWSLRIAVIMILAALWEVVSVGVGGIEAGLPGPFDVLKAVGPAASDHATWLAIGRTLRAWLIGFILAALIGLAVGATLGMSKMVDHATRPTIDFLRTIPPIAILPLGALLLGVNLQFQVIFVVIGGVWPILIQTMYGVGNTEPGLLNLAALLRMNRRSKMRLVLIPSAIPFIATGVRLSAVIVFLLAISVELLSGVPGVGSAIYRAQFAGQYSQMYLYVLIATLLGAAIGILFVFAERRVKSWAGQGTRPAR